MTVHAPLRSRRHRHWGPILDQGDLGSCTGNAITQALNTTPLRTGRPLLDETAAVRLYSTATTLDPFDGQYPPTDTGSSGLTVCKAAQQAGFISRYEHAFSLSDALAALATTPIIVGTAWHEGMFTPDPDGRVHVTGDVVGGHEYALVGINVPSRTVEALNSWGPAWGANGRFTLSWDDLGALLADDGDATVPVR